MWGQATNQLTYQWFWLATQRINYKSLEREWSHICDHSRKAVNLMDPGVAPLVLGDKATPAIAMLQSEIAIVQ